MLGGVTDNIVFGIRKRTAGKMWEFRVPLVESSGVVSDSIYYAGSCRDPGGSRGKQRRQVGTLGLSGA